MALRTGLEPMTLRLTAACSTNWTNEAYWRPEGDLNPWPLAWQASVLTNWTTRPYMWEYHHPLWQRLLCAAFLTSGRIKCLEFIYPKIHTKLPLCLERLVSCIHCIGRILPPKETVSTLVDRIIYLGCSSNSIYHCLYIQRSLIKPVVLPDPPSTLYSASFKTSWHQNYDQ